MKFSEPNQRLRTFYAIAIPCLLFACVAAIPLIALIAALSGHYIIMIGITPFVPILYRLARFGDCVLIWLSLPAERPSVETLVKRKIDVPFFSKE